MEFCADVSNACKSVVAVDVFASESSYWPLLENFIFYHVLTYCSGDINTESALFLSHTERPLKTTLLSKNVHWKLSDAHMQTNLPDLLVFADINTKLQKNQTIFSVT